MTKQHSALRDLSFLVACFTTIAGIAPLSPLAVSVQTTGRPVRGVEDHGVITTR